MTAIQARLIRRKRTVATAESCTGGLLGAVLTAHGGSSDFYRGGSIVYANEAKTLFADVGLGITGIAGPGGATPGKPVGLIFVAIDSDDHSAVRKNQWPYDRDGNRLAAVGVALDLLQEALA